MEPIGEHINVMLAEDDPEMDCCWTDSFLDGEQWWRIDIVRGRAVTYCYQVWRNGGWEPHIARRRP